MTGWLLASSLAGWPRECLAASLAGCGGGLAAPRETFARGGKGQTPLARMAMEAGEIENRFYFFPILSGGLLVATC